MRTTDDRRGEPIAVETTEPIAVEEHEPMLKPDEEAAMQEFLDAVQAGRTPSVDEWTRILERHHNRKS